MRPRRMAARLSDSDDMRAGNPNSCARRIAWWPFAAFSMLLAVAGRASAAPGGSVRAASHFTIADFDGDNRPDFASVHVGQSGLQDTRYWIAFQLSGGFGQTVSVTAPTGGLRITARDVKGDSFFDVVITTAWTNKTVAIPFNDYLGKASAS